jgi:hypothetical protein
METSANRYCDKCKASHFGPLENFNEWIVAHNLAEHTSPTVQLVAELEEELEFLSSEPSKHSIKDRIEVLKLKIRTIHKLSEGKGESLERIDRNVSGSVSGFALS